jgi:integrase
VADVLNIYQTDVAPKHARPKETIGRIERLLGWWRTRPLSDVNGRNCRLYAKERGSLQAARRELEDLRAAIKHHRKEGLCREVVEVVLPEKSQPRQRWLTRSEVARLVWTAWRMRDVQNDRAIARRTHQHIARFILIAVYTGSRAGTVCAASFARRDGFGWIDTTGGVFHRRPEDQAETKKRRPAVRLAPRLLAHLRRWERGIKGENGVIRKLHYPVEFYGRPVAKINLGFARVAKDADVPGATPHTLRHTAATWLMQAGVDKREAAGFLGMTDDVMERVYSHHHADYQKAAAEAIGRRRKK